MKKVLGLMVCDNKSAESLSEFFSWLIQRSLHDVDLVVSDHHSGLKNFVSLKRLNEEIRRREKVIRIFPNRESFIRLIGALLIEQ